MIRFARALFQGDEVAERDAILRSFRFATDGLGEFFKRLVYAGTEGYARRDRRSLAVANVTGYLASISSMSYALSYAVYDLMALQGLVLWNVVSATLTSMTPLVHRFGRLAGVGLLTTTVFVTIFYFISVLGHDSGIQLNYIGVSAVAFAILGAGRWRVAAFIIALGSVLHLAAWFLYPVGSADAVVAPWYLTQLYVFSALSIMALVGAVVFYVLWLLQKVQARSDRLLANVMPEAIAERLMAQPDATIAEEFDQATVLFADMCGFTELSAKIGPPETVALLDELYSEFDQLATKHRVEKIKTMGDAYMAVSGAPTPRPDHVEAMAVMAFGMREAARRVSERTGHPFGMRIGLATGSVMAGVIGRSKFAYDVWGDTVNVAARVEGLAQAGEILVSESVKAALEGGFAFELCGEVELRGVGRRQIWCMGESPLELSALARARKSGQPADLNLGETPSAKAV